MLVALTRHAYGISRTYKSQIYQGRVLVCCWVNSDMSVWTRGRRLCSPYSPRLVCIVSVNCPPWYTLQSALDPHQLQTHASHGQTTAYFSRVHLLGYSSLQQQPHRYGNSCAITPGRGVISAFTPATEPSKAGTWFSAPVKMQGWVNLVTYRGGLPPHRGHPSHY